MFLGISGPNFCFSPEAFSPPMKKIDKSTPEKVKSRMRLNFAFFISNYALVVAGVALVVALMHPGMIFLVGIVWSCWGFHYYLISNELLLFGHNVGTLVGSSRHHPFIGLFKWYLSGSYLACSCFSAAGIHDD
jgi:hypothetical protein